MKKLVVLSLIAVLCLSLQSAAVVIGDFEGGMDGWTMQSGATGTVSTFGATTGINSLEVVFPPNWIAVMKLDVMSYGSDLDELQTISFDVTARNDNGQIPAWWLETIIVLNTQNAGWKDSGNLFGGVPWSPTTYSLVWTVPQSIRDLLATGPGGWAEVLIVTNTGSTGGTMWVDNVQMTIPEPATLSMLGLGALALLKRRKA